jgi:hypothetical protein
MTDTNDDGKRGNRFRNPNGVLAYERHKTVYCHSMAEAMMLYDLPSTSTLKRMIDSGQIWAGDGYTTFDWALEA